jgi:cytochrome c oxidase subunit 2
VGGCATHRTPDTLHPVGSVAQRIATLWWVLLILALIVFAAVATLIAYGARSGPGRNPGGWSDQRFIVVGGIVVPFVILSVVAALTVIDAKDLANAGPGKPLQIEVIGHRWWWEVRYPDTGFVSANEIRVPIDQPIHVTVRSVDVIHSLWIPQVAGKADAIPGQPNHLVFDVDHTGVFGGECAEFCGVQHTNMDISLVAMTPTRFAAWQAAHLGVESKRQPTSKLARRGLEVFENQPCAGCHTVTGTTATGRVGPALTDIGERQTLGGGALANSSSSLARWLGHTQAVKPGALMPTIPLTNAQVSALVAYLEGLR